MLLKQRDAYYKWLHAPLVVGLTDKDQALLASSLIPTTNVDVAAEVVSVLATNAVGRSGQQRGKGRSSSSVAGMAPPHHLHPSHKPLMTFIGAQQEERNGSNSTAPSKGASVSSKAPSSSSSFPHPYPSNNLANPLPLFKDCYRRCSLCHKLVVLRYAEKHTTSAACVNNRLPSASAVAAADEECRVRIRLMGIQMDFEAGASVSGGGRGGAVCLEAAGAAAGAAAAFAATPPAYTIPLPLSPAANAVGYIDEGFVRQFTMLVVNNLGSRFEDRFGGSGGNGTSSSSVLSELLYGWASGSSSPSLPLSGNGNNACHASPSAVIVSSPTPLVKEAPPAKGAAKGAVCDAPATPNVSTPAVATATASAGATAGRAKRGGVSASLSVPPTPAIASVASLQPPSTPSPTTAAVSKSNAAVVTPTVIPTTLPPAISPALFASWLALPCYYAVEDREVAGMCATLGLLALSRHCDWAAAAEAYAGLVGVSAEDDDDATKKKNGNASTKKQPIAIAPYSPSSLLLLAGGGGGKGEDAAVAGGLALPHDPLDAEGNYIRRKGKWPAMPAVPDVPTYVYNANNNTKSSSPSSSLSSASWPSARHLMEHHQRRLKGLTAIAGVSASSQQSALRRCSCCLSLISYRNFARHERSDGCTAAGQDYTSQSYIHRRVLGDVEHRLFANGASGAPSTAELRVIRACISAGMGAMRGAAVAADATLLGRDGCADNNTNDGVAANAAPESAAASTATAAKMGAKRGRDADEEDRTSRKVSTMEKVLTHSAVASVKEKEKAFAAALVAAEKEERGPRGGIEREEAAAVKMIAKEEREVRLVADKAAKEAAKQTAALGKAAEKEASAKMALAAQRRAVIAQFVPYSCTAPTAARAHDEEVGAAGAGGAVANKNKSSSSTDDADNASSVVVHPRQHIPIPTVRCYAPCYASTCVAGVPFLLGTDICGVVFKDTSCVTLTTKGVLTYVNRHRHRFSLRPPSKDTRITVPSRLEKKVAAVLWVREVFTHQEAARHALGFVDVPPPSSTPSLSVASSSGDTSSHRVVVSVRTIPCPRHFITADDFGASCDAMQICPLAMLSVLATGGGATGEGGNAEKAAGATASQSTATAPPLLPPLPLYVSSVEGIDWGSAASAASSARAAPSFTASPQHATFTVSNHSALYPNQVYYDSDGEDNDNATTSSK